MMRTLINRVMARLGYTPTVDADEQVRRVSEQMREEMSAIVSRYAEDDERRSVRRRLALLAASADELS